MVEVIKRNSPPGRLAAILKRMSRGRKEDARQNDLEQFVGAIHFKGDPVKAQKAMRRDKR